MSIREYVSALHVYPTICRMNKYNKNKPSLNILNFKKNCQITNLPCQAMGDNFSSLPYNTEFLKHTDNCYNFYAFYYVKGHDRKCPYFETPNILHNTQTLVA